MKKLNTLLLLLFASTALWAQQPTIAVTKRAIRCSACVRRVVKTQPAAPTLLLPHVVDFFVAEARVDVTKDETVIRLAMAQHGSVLIELPANDGPRYIIPGDPEMATVDQKALERNKRAIVVRPGAQFLPPLRNVKARTPAATVTAQMRSGLVVTFLFYPVEDLAQNVHRCVLAYSRDEVVARRRAAGLPVNLADDGGGGEMTTQPAASSSLTVEVNSEESTKPKGVDEVSGPATSPKLIDPSSEDLKKKERLNVSAAAAAREMLQAAIKLPKQFKKWTKPVHGLALSVLQPREEAGGFSVVIVAVKNKTSASLKLTPGIPELLLEMFDDQGKSVNLESIKTIAMEASNASGSIPAGATIYYAVAYVSPVLNAHQQVKLMVGHTNAADEPASIVLASNGR